MITGVHAIMFSKKPDRLRALFRDVFGYRYADAGDGWLIFAMPPAELAFHPTNKRTFCELYLMCDDINATVEQLKKRGLKFAPRVEDAGWGLLASIKLPDGSHLGLYEPRHATPLAVRRKRSVTRKRGIRA
jgi:predicted enzyme related to lactoylglutathione lyase